MRLRSRILVGVLAVLALGVISLAVVISHDSPCGTADAIPVGTAKMNAIVYRCYGSSDVLELEQIAKPTITADQILVRVRAAAVNPLDYHYMTGKPYIMRAMTGFGAPKDSSMGVDYAGTVEAVGKNVTRFKPGDDVFGGRTGAFGEYVAVRENRAVVLKPANVTFEQAAAVPVAALTALQALRDKGHLQAGQKVLINGASGGVGTFAVQIAKSLGAEVTGVCSTRNVETVASIGADHVIDYTKENFTESRQQYDLILDNVGNHSFSALRGVLKPEGAIVTVGGPNTDPWLGPMTSWIKAAVIAPFVRQKLIGFVSKMSQSDLNQLATLMQEGKLTPVIDKRYPLSEVATAVAYVEGGHARGKVVINVE